MKKHKKEINIGISGKNMAGITKSLADMRIKYKWHVIYDDNAQKVKIGDKVKLKAKTREQIDKKIYEKISEGWAVITEEKQTLLGNWFCWMEKVK